MNEEALIWPNFYVVGAPKCGTTSIWAYLRKHPQVFLPKFKEPSYFISAPPLPGFEDTYCNGDLERYQGLYREANGHKAVGDCSPGYLWDQRSAQWIHEVRPDGKIVILLRDPVDRAYSHYYMFALVGEEKSSFFDAVKRDNSASLAAANQWNNHLYLETGLYYEQVRRYVDIFGAEQVGIYLFEDMEKDPHGVMTAICNHIGVDPALLDADELAQVHNAGRVPRVKWLYDTARSTLSFQARRKILPTSLRQWMRKSPLLYKHDKPPRDEGAAKYLQSVYEPDLCQLEELLGRKFPELRRTWI